MENPNTWSVAATIINEAVEEWYNKDMFHFSSIGIHVENKLTSAGLLVSDAKAMGVQPRPTNE
jgi:hypothetical protein